MSEMLGEYFEALERLNQGKPLHGSVGIKFSNDSVALEAGRNKGEFKNSGSIFAD